MWFRVEDNLADHPKVIAAGNQALGLWLRCGTWCAAHGTAGLVPSAVVRMFGGRRVDIDALVKAGLWEREGVDAWRFHDWRTYQPVDSTEQMYRDRQRVRGAAGNHTRWHAGRGVTDPDCPLCDSPGDSPGDSHLASPSDSPGDSPSESRTRDPYGLAPYPDP